MWSALTFLASVGWAGTPDCSLAVDRSPLLGEPLEATVTFANSGSATGFGPMVEVAVPPEFEVSSSMALGLDAPLTVVGTLSTSTPLVNPLSGDDVLGPDGWTLVVVQLPLAGLSTAAPAVDVDLVLSQLPGTEPGVDYDMWATCQFALGITPVDDPDTDPALRDDDPLDPVDGLMDTVTPIVMELTKEVVPVVTPNGSSCPVTFTLTADVAAAETVTGPGGGVVSLLDTMPEGFVVTGVTAPGGAVVLPAAFPTQGGLVQVDYPSLTGAAAAVAVIDGYYEQTEINTGLMLVDPVTGAPSMQMNTAEVVAAEHVASGFDATPPPSSTLNAVHAFVVEETITNTTRLDGTLPGDILEICLDIKVSDFSDIDVPVLTSVLGDGLSFSSSADPGFGSSVAGAGDTTVVTHDAPAALIGPVTHSICFEAVVDETYSDGSPVLTGDAIGTVHEVDALLNGATFVTESEFDSDADASVSISAPVFTKAVVAVNGSPPTATNPVVQPLDVVTFRLTADIVSGDAGGVTLQDWFPSPVFDADEHGASPAVTVAGPVRYGPDHTGPLASSTAATDALGTNELAIVFPAFDSSPSAGYVIDIELDYTVTDLPVADLLPLTNVAQASTTSTGGPSPRSRWLGS